MNNFNPNIRHSSFKPENYPDGFSFTDIIHDKNSAIAKKYIEKLRVNVEKAVPVEYRKSVEYYLINKVLHSDPLSQIGIGMWIYRPKSKGGIKICYMNSPKDYPGYRGFVENQRRTN